MFVTDYKYNNNSKFSHPSKLPHVQLLMVCCKEGPPLLTMIAFTQGLMEH